MALAPPLRELNISRATSGFYSGFNKTVALTSKILISLIVIWAVIDPAGAGDILQAMKNWSFQNLNTFYIYSIVFFILVCFFISLWPAFGRVKLGDPDGEPEFSTFSWFSMMFGAGIGIGMLGYAAGEPLFHFANNPDIIASKSLIEAAMTETGIAVAADADVFALYTEQVAAGTLTAIDGLVMPLTESALDSAYRFTFLHWGLGAWACYAIVGISLAFFSYSRGLPLTIRSALTPLFGRSLEGGLGHVVDIVAVIATILGISQTIGLGLSSFASGLHNITGLPWLMTTGDSPEPTVAALLFSLAIVMCLSTLSALSGVGKGIKWLSNLNMVLSFGLLAFFIIFGATLFSLQLMGKGLFSYLIHLPAMHFTVWDPASAKGGWQTGWSVFYWAWWIAFAPFVGIFLARISKNRTIREFAAGAIIAPALMCFIWFTVVGGTAIDLELNGDASGRILNSNLTYQMYEIVNIMLSAGLAQIMSIMIVVLLLTYLVTSADSAVLVVNTINAGGDKAATTGPTHIIVWGLMLTAIIGALLLAGGLNAIQSAMIIGAVPFTVVMILMGISLLKALFRDRKRLANG